MTENEKQMISILKEIENKIITKKEYPSGGISSNESFSNRLENIEKIQRWAINAGIPISKKIVFDFTFIKDIKYKINTKPTREEVFQIIEKLLTIETID